MTINKNKKNPNYLRITPKRNQDNKISEDGQKKSTVIVSTSSICFTFRMALLDLEDVILIWRRELFSYPICDVTIMAEFMLCLVVGKKKGKENKLML